MSAIYYLAAAQRLEEGLSLIRMDSLDGEQRECLADLSRTGEAFRMIEDLQARVGVPAEACDAARALLRERLSKAGNVPLLNDKWQRSPKMPDWAICFDPENGHFLWKFRESYGNWVSTGALTAEELQVILDRDEPLLAPFHALVRQRLDEMQAHMARQRGAAGSAA